MTGAGGAPEHQTTLEREVGYSGVGLHTGEPATVTFRPAPENTGIVFVRGDLPGKPRIPVAPGNARYDEKAGRRTILAVNGAEVHTVEHVLAAVSGLGIDNVEIEISAMEPADSEDGSALPIARLLLAAGRRQQAAERRYFTLGQPVSFREKEVDLVALPHDGLRISFTIQFPGTVLGTQHASFEISSETFVSEIAPARTFVLQRDVDRLREMGLIRGGSTEKAVVVREDGFLYPDRMRFADECVRHKVLDLLGDLTLLGRPFRGHVIAFRSGHSSHVRFVKEIERVEHAGELLHLPPIPTRNGPHWDQRAIQQILPHRYPFLLVDRIVELEPRKRVVGVKNVTMNEAFFTGHFPGHPIMPAVLIIEAMAQVGGILLLHMVDRPKEKLVYFMGIDRAKFRKPVLPGDQLRFELTLLRLKGRICKMAGKAFVEDTLVAEADLLSMVVDR